VSNLSVAQQRQASELGRLHRRAGELDQEISRRNLQMRMNCTGPEVIAEALRPLRQAHAEAEQAIADLESLNDDALVSRFVPEARPVEAVLLTDALARGERGPAQRVVSREPLPVRHEGVEASPVQPTATPPGRTYGYDRDGNLVALD
jgi:hypothetical protein